MSRLGSDMCPENEEKDTLAVNALSLIPGLQNALSLMDNLTTQTQYRTHLLSYRGMTVKPSPPKCDEGDDVGSVKEGSVGSSRRAPIRLSTRQSRLLSGLSHVSHTRLETASQHTDDHDTTSLATDVEGRSTMTMPRLHVLWEWKSDQTVSKSVTSMAWKSGHEDVLAVGYGSLAFTPHSLPGSVAFWSLKHPEQPLWRFPTSHGVTALAFSDALPQILAVGMYNGGVVLYDLQEKMAKAFTQSSSCDGGHTEPIWQLEWKSAGEGEEQLLSVSGDGRVIQWSINKGLEHSELMKLRRQTRKKSVEAAHPTRAPFISRLTSGLCLALCPANPSLYLVGTEDGIVHRCSTAYRDQHMDMYTGHFGPVYAVRWSPFHPDLFLTCGADWTVQMWLSDRSSPILTFHTTKEEITDVQWCPFQSTVFACVMTGGKIEIWDISISCVKPIAYHAIPSRSLTKLLFNPKSKVLMCGDDRGHITVLQLINVISDVSSSAQQQAQLRHVIESSVKD